MQQKRWFPEGRADNITAVTVQFDQWLNSKVQIITTISRRVYSPWMVVVKSKGSVPQKYPLNIQV